MSKYYLGISTFGHKVYYELINKVDDKHILIKIRNYKRNKYADAFSSLWTSKEIITISSTYSIWMNKTELPKEKFLAIAL
jgi:hypothetical protein